MASEEDHPTFNSDDFDDDDDNDNDSEHLNDAVPDDDDPIPADSDSSSDSDDLTVDTNSTSVTVAIPASIAPPKSSSSPSSLTVALPDPKRPRFDSSPLVVLPKPIDDSRRLFQRLWTDEDEIELLQGFLEYTTSRGMTASGHHHDTAAFYDQIKSKLQLEFNKNQLVEKLRRLKKKFRNVISKMSSGKEFVFKSPHDQITFEISNKIWSHLSINHRGGGGGVEFDDDDQNPNPNPNCSIVATPPPPSSGSGGYYISHINLNNAAAPIVDQKTNFGTIVPIMSNSPSAVVASPSKLSTRKRERPKVEKMDDKFVRVNLGQTGDGVNVNAVVNANNSISNNNNNNVGNVHVGPAIQGLIEETVRNSLSPMFKELINNAMNASGVGNKGVGSLASNTMPLNFSGVNFGNGGEIMDEKWRKQQILELEVYSKRLELVQDQIKLSLEELKSMSG